MYIKNLLIKSLNDLKKEINKRDYLYKHGVDLTNYENGYREVALNLVAQMFKHYTGSIGDVRGDIEWWLYEKVDKVYFINKKKVSVKTAKQFIEVSRKLSGGKY